MSWFIWLILGGLLGWWGHVVFGGKSPNPGQQDDGAQSAALIYVVLLAAAVLLASDPFLGWLPPAVYWFEGLLLSSRMLVLLSGAAIGFWASRYRQAIAARSADFYKAFLGTEANSSWALQSVVAIVALLLIVLAIKPDLLDHLESVKAGEVEAKFANVNITTRQANAITNELAKQSTIKQWIDFKKNYLDDSPRDNALEFDNSEIKEHRKKIRNILFDYVEPLALFIDCLNEDDRMDRLRKNEDFVGLAIIFRNKILQEAKDGSGAAFAMYDWISLFELADVQMRRAAQIIDAEIPKDIVKEKCPRIADIDVDFLSMTMKSQFNAMLADVEVSQAIKKLKASPDEKRYHLSFLDPYFINAVSDLIALTLGHTAKASFLMQVKSQYPKEQELIQPGIISIYYSLSDSKLKSDAPWPLDEEVEELDFAMTGAEHMINMSRKRADAVRQEAAKAGKPGNATRYDEIVGVYFTNKFVFMNRYLEIFCQHTLSGDTLSEQDRFKWARFYKQMESVLSLRELGTSLDLDGLGGAPARDLDEWRKIKIFPLVYFDARVAMAESAIMLTERKNRAPPQACAIGIFYLREAKDMLTDVASNEADRSRLRGYLVQIEARLKASCPDNR
jgi:hypothetical protein